MSDEDLTKATVSLVVGGGHSPDSIPADFCAWMETELTRFGLPYAFTGILKGARHTTGATPIGLRAVRVVSNFVLIVAKSGNNDTCREFYIRCSEMGPKELLSRINADKLEENEGEPKMADDPVSPEGGVAPAPALVEVKHWFPTDEAAMALMLTELAPLAHSRSGEGVKCFLFGQAKPVLAELAKKPRGKQHRHQDILDYLVKQGLLDHSQSETGAGQRNAYSLTPKAEEIVKKMVGESVPVPAPPAPPISPAPGKPGSSMSVIDFGLKVGGMAAEVLLYDLQLRQIRHLQKEEAEIEQTLEAKRVEIVNANKQLPPGTLETYEQLIAIAKSSDSNSGANGSG